MCYIMLTDCFFVDSDFEIFRSLKWVNLNSRSDLGQDGGSLFLIFFSMLMTIEWGIRFAWSSHQWFCCCCCLLSSVFTFVTMLDDFSLQLDFNVQRLESRINCALPIPSIHSSGAVWESRWTSWAVRPNEPSGFRGRKDLLHRASALVTTCP